MKFAFLSESEVDEAALAAFCAARLGREIERMPCRVRLRRGWPALKDTLGPALRSFKYTDVAFIVVCADGDGADPHHPDNRRAQLQRIVEQTGMSARVVVALAVPIIEAWWLAPQCPELHERGWFERLQKHPGYEKFDLKRRLYRTDRPLGLDMLRIMPEAARLAAVHHAQLATRFPLGLGPLLKKLAAIEAATGPDH